MGVSIQRNAIIRDGRNIREYVYSAGDASGGNLQLFVLIPRTFRLVKAYAFARVTMVGFAAMGYLTLWIKGGLEQAGGAAYECGWDNRFPPGVGASIAEFTNANLPVNSFPRSGSDTHQEGIFIAIPNTNTTGTPDLGNVELVVCAEVEKVDDTLKNAQGGGWSPVDFFKRLDTWLFGEQPGRFSTP